MTSKEYAKIGEFYKKHINLNMRGHVWLFNKAIKQIPAPDKSVRADWNEKRSLYLKPIKMKVEGEFLRIYDPQNGIVHIHHKWVQRLLLNNYNY